MLLLSAYAAGSHISWRQRLLDMMPEWDWVVLEMPPRYFSWRVRGNPLYWSEACRDELLGDFHLILATSMVDLSTLRGLVPELAGVPTALYFHENQFDYPQGRGRHGSLEPQVVSLYSALAADKLLFNSRYNLQGFIDGCSELLRRLPDRVPPGISGRLAAKAGVLPVPIKLEPLVSGPTSWPGQSARRPLRLIWMGRFEYDKGAERLLAVLRHLECSQLDYEIAVVGQQFRDTPGVFGEIRREFEHRLVHFGYIERRADYHALLRGADIVLSTALHEFQGIAVIEATAAGCFPVVPDRLAYREIYPSHCRYDSHLEDPGRESEAAFQALAKAWRGLQQGDLELPDIGGFSSLSLAVDYRRVLANLAARTG